jgi:predicted acylesterase/phospholipase RssA
MRIEELDLPLAVVAADMITQREVVLRRGLLWLATLASLSIPGVYPPQHSGPYTLVDDGVLNTLPSTIAADMGGRHGDRGQTGPSAADLPCRWPVPAAWAPRCHRSHRCPTTALLCGPPD